MSEVLTVADRIRKLVEYNSSTGLFTWATSRPGYAIAGRLAGRPHRDGYWRLNVMGKEYLAHRLAWFLTVGEWPKRQIDHINGVRNDNRIANLREATASDNAKNTGIYRCNKSGFKGVSARNGRWVAQIQVNGRKVSIGYFATKEAAAAAYAIRAEALFGEFFRRAA